MEIVLIYLIFGLVAFVAGVLITIYIIRTAINNSELNDNVKEILALLKGKNSSNAISDCKSTCDHVELSENYTDNHSN